MENKDYLMYAKVAKEVLENKLGFAPVLNNIVILESRYFIYKPSYIRFRVKGVKNINYIVKLNNYYKYDLEIFMEGIHL